MDPSGGARAPGTMSGRSVWIDHALVAPVPLAIFVANGLGGATGAGSGLMLVAAASVGAFAAWRTALSFSPPLDYRPLYPAAVCFLGLLAFVAWTAWQPSSGLRQAPLATLIGSPRVAIQADQTALELIKLTGLAVTVVCGFQLGSSPTRARHAVSLILILGLAWTLASLGLFLAGGQARLSGRFVSPNVAGCLLLCLLLLTLGRMVRRMVRRRGRLMDRAVQAAPYAAYAVLLILCLTLTASRSALALAVVLGPLLVGVLAWRARPGKWAWVAGAAVVVALGLTGLAFVADRGVLARLAETAIDAGDRWIILRAYWSAFVQSPVYGFGLGSAPTLAKMSMSPATYDALWNIRAVHNVYLQWLVEGGVIGTVLMFSTVVCLLAVAMKGAVRGAFESLAPFLAIDLVFLLQGLVDYSLQIPSVALMWALLLGLQAAAAARPARKPDLGASVLK